MAGRIVGRSVLYYCEYSMPIDLFKVKITSVFTIQVDPLSFPDFRSEQTQLWGLTRVVDYVQKNIDFSQIF